MAERRMFHASIVESDAFLDLPTGAQALYFHLGMHADDDGFVNGPKQIIRKLRRPVKELQLLIDTGFLLDFDGIVVLKHWRVANNWRYDRVQLPRYPELAKQIYIKPTKEYTLSRMPGAQNLLRQKMDLVSRMVVPADTQGTSQKKREEQKRKEKKPEENKSYENNNEGPGQQDCGASALDYIRSLQELPVSERYK